MKFWFIGFLMLITACAAHQQPPKEEFTFRRVKWGMSPEQVGEIEKKSEDSEFLGYKDTWFLLGESLYLYRADVYGARALVIYGFDLQDKTLNLISLVLPPNCLGQSSKYECQNGLVALLNEKYGEYHRHEYEAQVKVWRADDVSVMMHPMVIKETSEAVGDGPALLFVPEKESTELLKEAGASVFLALMAGAVGIDLWPGSTLKGLEKSAK